MFINPYTYATAGGLAMMPADNSYQQAFQQPMQPPLAAAAAAYPNLIPSQMQAVYMQQPQYQYAVSPTAVQNQAIQYARCYQVRIYSPYLNQIGY